jgi:hypothetical protein
LPCAVAHPPRVMPETSVTLGGRRTWSRRSSSASNSPPGPAGGTSRALAGWVAARHAVVTAALPWPGRRGGAAQGPSSGASFAPVAVPRADQGQAQLRLALVTVALGAVIRGADGGVAVAPAPAGPGVAPGTPTRAQGHPPAAAPGGRGGGRRLRPGRPRPLGAGRAGPRAPRAAGEAGWAPRPSVAAPPSTKTPASPSSLGCTTNLPAPWSKARWQGEDHMARNRGLDVGTLSSWT